MSRRTSKSRFELPRRTLLRGALSGSAVAVGLPILEAMLNSNGTALAQGQALPRRLGIFFWGNGVRLAQWNPPTTGTDYVLSPELEPLANHQAQLSVISGMDLKTGNPRGHHAGCVGILSGAPLVEQPAGNANYRSTFGAPSIDQVAAEAIGDETQFRSLEVGISTRVARGEGTTLQYLSHNGPDNANPPEYDAAAVYDRIFGDFSAPDATPTVDLTLGLRRSILDAVRADINDLNQRVGSIDRQRLEQHLDNIRDLEQRIDLAQNRAPVGAACELLANPGSIQGEDNRREPLEERMRAMSGLIAMGLACDLTRVFSVMFSGSVGSTVFWQVGVDQGHHQLSHDEPGDQPQIHATTVYTMEMFAILLDALKELPEGDGSLLDQSVILASTDVAEGQPHSIEDYPILVAGGGGGFLGPGVHYRSDGENASQVLLSVLRAAGLELDEFGVDGGQVTSGCSAIEA